MRRRPTSLLAVTATVIGVAALPAVTAAAAPVPKAAAHVARPWHAIAQAVRAQALAGHRVELSWTVPREHGYAGLVIRRGPGLVAPTSAGGVAVARVDAHTHAYLDPTVTPGRTYSYALFARNNAGRLGPAARATVHLPAQARPMPHHGTVRPQISPQIAGTVTGLGTPLGNVDVDVYDTLGNYVGDTYTADNGSYGIDVLPARAAAVTADTTGYIVCFDARYATGGSAAGGYASQCHDGVPWNDVDIPAGVTPVMPTEGTTTEVDADLSAGGGLAGAVSGTDGSRLANAYVTVYDAAGELLSGTYTDGTGRYSITGLLGGASYFMCTDGSSATGSAPFGYLSRCWKTAPYDGYEVPSGATPIPVTAGSVTGRINVRLGAAGAIAGTVTEAGPQPQPQNTLQNYDVDVFDARGRQLYPAVTEQPDGTYQVIGVAPGSSYTVCFNGPDATGGDSAAGYQAQCYDGIPWNPSSGAPPSGATPVSVTGGSETTGVDAALAAAGGIAGTVTSSTTGQDVRGVDVEVLTEAGDYVADTSTGSNGQYQLSGLPVGAGDYLVCFGASGARGGGSTTGYLSQCYDGAPWDGFSIPTGATPVAVTAGASTPVDAALDPAGAISGLVTSSDGAQLANVSVIAFDAYGNSVAYAQTSSTGRYRMTGLTPTSAGYYVCFDASQASGGASAGGYRSQCYRNKVWNGQYDGLPGSMTPVPVTSGNTSGNINARLTPGGAISGVVTADDNGAGLAGIDVQLLTRNGDYVTDTFTDASGAYRFNGLAAFTTYHVCFRADSATGGPSAAGYLDECYDNVPWDGYDVPSGAATVAVRTGAETAGINASLADAAAVSGRVTSDATGQGVTDVEVDAYDASDDLLGYAFTDGSGQYVLTGLPANAAGDSICFATSSASGGGVSSGYVPECYDNVPWDGYSDPTSTATPVPVTAGSVTPGIDASLASAGGISGRVTSASGGAGLADVDVMVTTADDIYLTDLATGSDGSYRIVGLPPSSTGYVVCFDATNASGGPSTTGYLSQCYNNQPWTGGEPPAGVTLVPVTAGAVHGGINARLRGGAAIQGTVTAVAGGNPVGDVDATVFAGSNYVADTTTSGDGTYRIAGLPAGTYTVCFDAGNAYGAPSTGYADQCWQNAAWDGRYGAAPSSARTFVLRAGSARSGIDAQLGLAGAISGQITSATTGNGVLEGDALVYDNGGLVSRYDADSSGNYLITGLNPATGPYTVCFVDYGDRTGSATGYAPQCYQGVPWDGGIAPPPAGTIGVAVPAGGTTTGIDAVLTRGAAISGKVTDAGTGDPAGAVYPTVFDTAGNKVADSYLSSSGGYRVNSLAPGKYVVCFEVDSAQYAPQCWNNIPWDGSPNDLPSDATLVTVTAGGLRGSLNAAMTSPPA